MTLDEARGCLDIGIGASTDEIREAFRRKARDNHPDRHPGADSSTLSQLARDFDRAREARDILLRYTLDTLRKPAPSTNSRERETQPSSTYSYSYARSESAPRSADSSERADSRRAAFQPDETRGPAPRVTMRFDEFVAWTDTAGFGAGNRSRPWVDWPRIIVWSSLAALVIGLTVAGFVMTRIAPGMIESPTTGAAPPSPVPIAFEQSFVTEGAAYAAPECTTGCWVWEFTPSMSSAEATATIALYETPSAIEPTAFHEQHVGAMTAGKVQLLVVPTEPGMPPHAALQGIFCAS